MSMAAVFLVTVNCQTADSRSECLFTDTECACSAKATAGACMRSQGSGLCLMGECAEGYHCDCFGYEKCKRSSCSLYTAVPNTVPSKTEPFKCQLNPNTGSCTSFVEFLDTVDGAEKANNEAKSNMDESSEFEKMATETISKIQEAKDEIAKLVKGTEEVREFVTEEEYSSVIAESDVVVAAAVAANIQALEVAKESAEAYKSKLEAVQKWEEARMLEQAAVAKEGELEVESAKPENKERCDICEEMKAEIKRVRDERRAAAIAAGTYAKKGKGHRAKATQSLKNCEAEQLTAEEARARCIAKSTAIMERIRAQQAQQAQQARRR